MNKAKQEETRREWRCRWRIWWKLCRILSRLWTRQAQASTVTLAFLPSPEVSRCLTSHPVPNIKIPSEGNQILASNTQNKTQLGKITAPPLPMVKEHFQIFS